MNRTQKKCFIASAGFHLLLLMILLIGPAFLSRENPVDESPILEFIPVITTYDNKQGGGDPNVKSLPAALQERPPTPQPAKPPTPVRQRDPEPDPAPPEPVKKPVAKPEPEEKKDSDSLEVNSKPRKPQVNLTMVKRPSVSREANRAQAEREAADNRRRLAQQLDRAVSGIKGGLSGSTEIRLKGPGGGGLPYANFFDAVKSVYARAWRVPDGAADDSATAVASVVIARDGSVLSARIIKSSGNAAVDRSVQSTLERVKFAAPLPASEKESQREVTINFNVSAVRQLLG